MAQGTNPYLFSIDAFPGGPALNGTHCRSCSEFALMHLPVCPQCLSREVEDVPLGRTAKLRYWSVVHHPADGFPAPYVIGEVETEEGPIAFAPIVADPTRLAAGVTLTFRLRPTADGTRMGFAYMLPEAAP